MISAFLALGSNMGDREAILRDARNALNEAPGLHVTAWSALYETEPVGGPSGQGPYLNAVLQTATSLTAAELLSCCLAVETRFGRVRRETWGPRTLDVDLLFFGREIRSEPNLELPHPRLHLRPFVLMPLAELAPDFVHPLLGRTIGELAAAKQSEPGVQRLCRPW
jgi:2-amino-4-hydroxy-6-hydroxymethyldihydropteridine diphosphokinase